MRVLHLIDDRVREQLACDRCLSCSRVSDDQSDVPFGRKIDVALEMLRDVLRLEIVSTHDACDAERLRRTLLSYNVKMRHSYPLSLISS